MRQKQDSHCRKSVSRYYTGTITHYPRIEPDSERRVLPPGVEKLRQGGGLAMLCRRSAVLGGLGFGSASGIRRPEANSIGNLGFV